MVTYCPAVKESEVIVQHSLGSPGLVMEETDDTPLPLSPLLRDCKRGHGVALSGQDPGAKMRAAATQEAEPTEQGMWSIQRGLLGLDGWANDQGTIQNDTEAKGSCPIKRSRSLIQIWPQSQFSDPEPRNRDGRVHGRRTTANRHRNDPSPSQRDLGVCNGEPTQGGGTTRGVQVARSRINLTPT